MKNEIKIGIIGLGSIGLRHVNELIQLGVSRFYALRTNKGSKTIPNQVLERITSIYDIEEFLELQLEGYIISNPTSLHSEALSLILRKNKPIFIEKPLFANLEDFDFFKNIDTEKIQVGFCLRFNSFFQKVKEYLDSDVLGDVYHSRLNVGQYLPSWHPYTDYRTEYFAQKELGGGAIRTLSHEIDLSFFFFGSPSKSKTYIFKTSDLEIDVDDYALVLNEYHSSNICRIEMDFLNMKKERKGFIYGSKCNLHYNFFDNKICIYNRKGEEIISEQVVANNMYAEQMKSFLSLIKTGHLSGSTWQENILITKIIHNEKSF